MSISCHLVPIRFSTQGGTSAAIFVLGTTTGFVRDCAVRNAVFHNVLGAP
jgi:hypothetical protein